MQAKNYTIREDIQSASYDNIKQVYIASKDEYKIVFYECSDKEDAINLFNNNKSFFETLKSSDSTEKSIIHENDEKYTLLSKDKYMVISRIDNAFIVLNVDIKYKSEIDNILKELGY